MSDQMSAQQHDAIMVCAGFSAALDLLKWVVKNEGNLQDLGNILCAASLSERSGALVCAAIADDGGHDELAVALALQLSERP